MLLAKLLLFVSLLVASGNKFEVSVSVHALPFPVSNLNNTASPSNSTKPPPQTGPNPIQ